MTAQVPMCYFAGLTTAELQTADEACDLTQPQYAVVDANQMATLQMPFFQCGTTRTVISLGSGATWWL